MTAKLVCCGLCLVLAGAAARAATAPTEAKKRETGWFNTTDLSFVDTQGNSETTTFGLKNQLRRVWKKVRFQLKLDSVTSDTADDPYLRLDPGYTWDPGGQPTDVTTSLVRPPKEPDIAKYFIEASTERQITEALIWNAGASWDRDEDAGVLNRYIVFGGIGNKWWRERDELSLTTTYGLSWTDREEESPDPDKEDRFAGVRLGWAFSADLGKVTTYTNEMTGNMSLKDFSDYNVDMTNAFAVRMGKHLSLKVSLQWLYSNEPALEDVDVLAYVDLIDPDGIPGSGDEFFESVESGGTEIEVGESRVRKRKLDTILRTSLSIEF